MSQCQLYYKPIYHTEGLRKGLQKYYFLIVRPQECLNLFTTGHTLLCDWKYKLTKLITVYIVPKKHFLKCGS